MELEPIMSMSEIDHNNLNHQLEELRFADALEDDEYFNDPMMYLPSGTTTESKLEQTASSMSKIEEKINLRRRRFIELINGSHQWRCIECVNEGNLTDITCVEITTGFATLYSHLENNHPHLLLKDPYVIKDNENDNEQPDNAFTCEDNSLKISSQQPNTNDFREEKDNSKESPKKSTSSIIEMKSDQITSMSKLDYHNSTNQLEKLHSLEIREDSKYSNDLVTELSSIASTTSMSKKNLISGAEYRHTDDIGEDSEYSEDLLSENSSSTPITVENPTTTTSISMIDYFNPTNRFKHPDTTDVVNNQPRDPENHFLSSPTPLKDFFTKKKEESKPVVEKVKKGSIEKVFESAEEKPNMQSLIPSINRHPSETALDEHTFYNSIYSDFQQQRTDVSHATLIEEKAYREENFSDGGLLCCKLTKFKEKQKSRDQEEEEDNIWRSKDSEKGESIAEENTSSNDVGNEEDLFYLNTAEPFCLVAVGVQGSGKSHTMNVVLENCLTPCPLPAHRPLVGLSSALCGLVLHYDQHDVNICEAVGLSGAGVSGGARVRRMVVLVSPTYYEQRKRFYEGYEVYPLLFGWASLKAQHIKTLMNISDDDTQLYIALMLNMLRDYQRVNKIPNFATFKAEITERFSGEAKGQAGPLNQRLEILENFVAESEKNKDLLPNYRSISDLMASGTLIVVDLSDPILPSDTANGVFQLALGQFRDKDLSCGKVVAFDEAHKYLSATAAQTRLSSAILDTVRVMRHEGIRVLISTQSPKVIPPELLELTTVAVLHRFQSKDWFEYLAQKINLQKRSYGFQEVCNLEAGEALIWCSRICARGLERDDTIPGKFRKRITMDLGASRSKNNKKSYF